MTDTTSLVRAVERYERAAEGYGKDPYPESPENDLSIPVSADMDRGESGGGAWCWLVIVGGALWCLSRR